MDFADFFRAVFALALTLGLVGLAAVGLRRLGPDALARYMPARKLRRMSVVETLVLDPARRLVIIACDGEERLLLLGEGQILSPPVGRPAEPVPPRAQDPLDA
jgi:flagellar protein FliO/FliZ